MTWLGPFVVWSESLYGKGWDESDSLGSFTDHVGFHYHFDFQFAYSCTDVDAVIVFYFCFFAISFPPVSSFFTSTLRLKLMGLQMH